MSAENRKKLEEFEDAVRPIVMVAAGAAGGPILSLLLEVAWPERDPTAGFMRELENLRREMKQAFDDRDVEEVVQRLDGLQNNAENYLSRTVPGAEKGGDLKYLRDVMTERREEFFPSKYSPEVARRILPFFAMFGSLYLSTLLERRLRYVENYGEPDKQPEVTKVELKKAVNMLHQEAVNATKRIVEWRGNFFGWADGWDSSDWAKTSWRKRWWEARDDFEAPGAPKWKENGSWRVPPGGDGWFQFPWLKGEERHANNLMAETKKRCDERRQKVMEEMQRECDKVLAVASLWPDMIPAADR